MRDLSTDGFQVRASNPGGVLRVNHVSSSEAKGGMSVTARWGGQSSTCRGGMLGHGHEGKPPSMIVKTRLPFAEHPIVEEWTVFDRVGVRAQAYRP